MSDINELMEQLNFLDTQILKNIQEIEEKLTTCLTTRVEIKFQDGALAWIEHDSKWQLIFVKDNKYQPLLSASRQMRADVADGLHLLINRIKDSIEDAIKERRKAVETLRITLQTLPLRPIWTKE